MANQHVIKLAQPGYDVKTTGDENLIYNSLWPLLKIYKQGSVTINDVTQSQVLATHDLGAGFFPVYWYFSNSAITGWENSGAQSIERRSEFFGPLGGGTLKVNDTQLLFSPASFPTTTGSVQLYYYIFALDLSIQYNAPIINVGDVRGASDPTFVFKLARSGKSVSSKNLEDFVIHSRARSPLIHSVNPSGKAVTSFVVNHNLGYLPMFFGFIKSGGYYTLIPAGQGGSSSLKSDENTITYIDTGAKELTIVVLKDPFTIDYSVGVNV